MSLNLFMNPERELSLLKAADLPDLAEPPLLADLASYARSTVVGVCGILSASDLPCERIDPRWERTEWLSRLGVGATSDALESYPRRDSLRRLDGLGEVGPGVRS
jgi:hypothetical protein|tara:strand:- start:233 stop:547 length:315 start_codon:yes stop_codon:yes gene_type:complete